MCFLWRPEEKYPLIVIKFSLYKFPMWSDIALKVGMHVEKQHTSSKINNKGRETITSDLSFSLNTFMAIIKMEI